VFCYPGALLRRVFSVLSAILLLSALPAAANQEPVTARLSTSQNRLAVGDELTVKLSIDIAEGWHINSDKPGQDFLIPTKVRFELPPGLKTLDVRYPKPTVEKLRFGGDKPLRLFTGKTVVGATLRYEKLTSVSTEPELLFDYQACNDTLCLPPQTLRIPIHVKLSMVEGVAYAGVNEEAADYVAGLLSRGWWVVIPAMLLFGLALNLTPCVYPLVSVTLAYFGSQAGHSRARRINLAIAYAAGIVLTFSALGVFAAVSGSYFGSALGNPVVNVAIAALMFVLALSSFGVFQLQMPATVTSKLGGSFGGAAGALFMGVTMGLVAAPCVGPFVVGMLLVVGSRGDISLGVELFSLLALGLGLPYVVLAMAAGSISRLPRSGDWLRWVEHVFGCVLLGMSVYFLEPVLPDSVQRVLMPLFLTGAIGYLAFLDPAGRSNRGFGIARTAAGILLIVLVAVEYVPARGTQPHLVFQDFSGARFLAAKKSGSPFVVDFSAEWCLPCQEMKEKTFNDTRVVEVASGVTFLSVDMTHSSDQLARVLKSFEVLGEPTIVFFGADGEEWTRRIGFVGPREFAKLLQQSRVGKAGESDKAIGAS